MSVSTFVRRQVLDLVSEKRVVVWFDGERQFGALARSLKAPHLVVISAEPSRLAARRQADAVLEGMNDPQAQGDRDALMLVYIPWSRGADEANRQMDPFEYFALIGAPFGDTEGERLPALARRALPQRSADIDRLFREGNPTLTMLDELGKGKRGPRFPLLKAALGTEASVEVVAQLLCGPESAAKLEATPGSRDEAERLLAEELGFQYRGKGASVERLLSDLGRYLLWSEFVFDLTAAVPDAVASVPRAAEAHKTAVYEICDHLRGSDALRAAYLERATHVEQELHLTELFRDAAALGDRDTFPFEERLLLAQVVTLACQGDISAAEAVATGRRGSVWRQQGTRAVLWKLVERCLAMLAAASQIEAALPGAGTGVAAWVSGYAAPDGLARLDLHQRRVEQSAAEGHEADELDPLVALCRRRYSAVVAAVQGLFQAVVGRDGWPPDGVLRQAQIFDRFVAPALADGRRVAYFLVDGMRFEMGQDLAGALATLGEVSILPAAAALPTITSMGMAALLPGADGNMQLMETNGELVPKVADEQVANSAARMEVLRRRFGDRFRDITLGDLFSTAPNRLRTKIGQADLLVVRTQEIDALGEGASLYTARKYMSHVIQELHTAAERLVALGFAHLVFAADHGHVLVQEVAAGDVVREPQGDWKMAKRRCRVGQAIGTAPGVIIVPAPKVGIAGSEHDLAVPAGLRVFSAGEGYFHGGISLQECVIPLVTLAAHAQGHVAQGGVTVELSYRSDRFTSRVVGLKAEMRSLLEEKVEVRIQAFSGGEKKAAVVGEAADCDARDPATGVVTLIQGKDTQVPVRVDDDFDGSEIELRALDPATGFVHARLKLKNGLMS